MKKLFIAYFVLMMSFSFAADLTKVKPVEAEKMLKEKKAILLDVREAEETKEGMAQEAQSLPLSMMNEHKADWEKIVSGYPKDKTIIVYCRSGRRSEIVGQELQKKGYKVLNMGGFDTWKEAKLPLKK